MASTADEALTPTANGQCLSTSSGKCTLRAAVQLADALLAGSPAIRAANPLGCLDPEGNLLPIDQRGFPRVGRCDIGAFEFVLRVLLPLVVR